MILLFFFLWGVKPELAKKQEVILQELKEKIEASKTETTTKARTFRGFTAVLRAEAEGLSVETPVRYENYAQSGHRHIA